MADIQSASGCATAQRLITLAHLYEEGLASDLMDRTLEKLLAHEAEVCRALLHQVQTDLTEIEQRYDLSSTTFYQRFQAGQTDDRMDYVEWASLVQMRDNLKKRLRLLTDEAQV